MNIIEQRLLRGPSLYLQTPCLMAVLQLEASETVDADNAPQRCQQLYQRLLVLMPGLAKRGGAARRLREGAAVSLGQVADLALRELQAMAGAAARGGRSAPIRNVPSRFRLVCGYRLEHIATEALTLAVAMINALARGADFDLATPLAALRAAARQRAVDPATAALIGTARERGMPVLRLSEESNEFQLGWGSRQKRLNAAIAGEAIVEPVYPEGDGRIPVIAVTGTNGKTTTCLMLAHAARLAGLGTGLTTTEGVFINGERIVKGDCSGYWSARTVLTTPEVDFAVLETARGGILKRGLAYDRCDVGVVLNVAADHLGLDGIDTVADLARVKAVVARSAARAVVLNAEDPHCVDMSRMLAPGVERLYFSLDCEQPVLLRHLERGGRGAYLQDGCVVIADGTRRHALLPAADMPASLGGHARYNIANALATAAALLASGFELASIAAGLRSFVSDNQTNPLRSNVFPLRDNITLIVDYAHNPAAYAALGQMAASMTSARLIGVITAPGDRRDADLVAVGAACAEHFDELMVYESSRRGRAAGGAGMLITEGIDKARSRCRQWHQIDSPRAALDEALAHCRPGDVLVFSCPGPLADLIDAVRVADPSGAQRIADEVAGVALSH
jgi:UDP-N-acetylmuramyl tripeptide synthase